MIRSGTRTARASPTVGSKTGSRSERSSAYVVALRAREKGAPDAGGDGALGVEDGDALGLDDGGADGPADGEELGVDDGQADGTGAGTGVGTCE